MCKTRVALLGVLALFIASGIAASTASAVGPYWHVNGAKFTAGTRQNKLQLKGNALLSTEISTTKVVITCVTSVAEGATIEGNGNNQGQDKGRIKYSNCSVNQPNCVVEPITTKPTKSYLVTFKGGQTKYADIIEPTEGEIFTTVKITKGTEACEVADVLEVKGSIAAELITKEKEQKEGLLFFPETTISPVFHEGIEKRPGLFLGLKPAAFSAAYGSALVTGETFGVFGS